MVWMNYHIQQETFVMITYSLPNMCYLMLVKVPKAYAVYSNLGLDRSRILYLGNKHLPMINKN